MKLILFGYGSMGRLLELLAREQGHEVIGIVSSTKSLPLDRIAQADVCLDFSQSHAVLFHLSLALRYQKPIIIGTTGWEERVVEAKNLVEKSDSTALYSPNFSLGVALFAQILSFASKIFSQAPQYDAHGIEMHHRHKKDAPSGTAKKLMEGFDGKLSFTSVRCGEIPGTHTVFFDSAFDTLTLTHSARTKEGFAQGALLAAEWIQGKKGWWTFDDMVRSLYSPYHTLSS